MLTPIKLLMDLFEATREKDFKKVTVHSSLYEYTYLLYRLYDQPTSLIEKTDEIEISHKPRKEIDIYTITGGKDSLGVYLKNRKINNKENLYYVQGINVPYPEEINIATEIAQKIGKKIELIDIGINPNTWLQDSVIKNQFIYGLVLDHLPYLPAKIGFGGTKKLGPQGMAFFHDSVVAFELFHEFAKLSWGDHELAEFTEDEEESYALIYKNYPYLLGNLSSCMTHKEDKKQLRENVTKKYNITSDNEYSCLSCYKCCERAIILNKNHDFVYNKEYLDFCKSILIEKVFSEYHMNGYPIDYLLKLDLLK